MYGFAHITMSLWGLNDLEIIMEHDNSQSQQSNHPYLGHACKITGSTNQRPLSHVHKHP
jgi:hypothetical protein